VISRRSYGYEVLQGENKMRLRRFEDYFSGEDCARALSSYSQEAANLGWSIPHKIKLYSQSRIAFDSDFPHEKKEKAFRSIYDDLAGYWQVFRPYGADLCWDSQKVFDSISRKFADFSPSGKVNLTTFEDSRSGPLLTKALTALQGIKPNNYYPVMTVSKFLHFFNPGLFLIWDTAVIDTRVLKRFWPDYLNFCKQFELNSTAIGVEFLRNYIGWATSIISNFENECMPTFCKWISNELDDSKLAEDCYSFSCLYATAFEFIAIGATVVDGY
jgi:hypothetical protein